jgi:putative ABC transport system permease protein
MMLDLIVKELVRRKSRTFLTVLGVSIGILLVASLSSFSEGINDTIGAQLSYLSGKVSVIEAGTGWASITLSEIDDTYVEELENLGGVKELAPLLIGSAPNVGAIYGFEPNDMEVLGYQIDLEEGRVVDQGEEAINLGYYFAENGGYETGDEIEIRGKKYEVVGVVEKLGSDEDYGVMASLEVAQTMTGKEGIVTLVIIQPYNVEEAKDIASEINRNYDALEAGTEEDAQREAQEFGGQLTVLTFGLGSISAIIAGLGIMNVMFMSVRERRKQIGVMKALGATTYTIMGQVLIEAMLITLIGASIGLLFSFFIVDGLNAMMGMELAKLTPNLIVSVFVFALVLGLISGFLPARAAAKLEPAVVLRNE